jgi:hypothetical protein
MVAKLAISKHIKIVKNYCGTVWTGFIWQYFRYSRRWTWRCLPSEMLSRVVWQIMTGISEMLTNIIISSPWWWRQRALFHFLNVGQFLQDYTTRRPRRQTLWFHLAQHVDQWQLKILNYHKRWAVTWVAEMMTVMILWDYVSELRPSTGLLFIPQMIYEHGEPWWNDDVGRGKHWFVHHSALIILPAETSGSKHEEGRKE